MHFQLPFTNDPRSPRHALQNTLIQRAQLVLVAVFELFCFKFLSLMDIHEPYPAFPKKTARLEGIKHLRKSLTASQRLPSCASIFCPLFVDIGCISLRSAPSGFRHCGMPYFSDKQHLSSNSVLYSPFEIKIPQEESEIADFDPEVDLPPD
jgi:hypothetical protein